VQYIIVSSAFKYHNIFSFLFQKLRIVRGSVVFKGTCTLDSDWESECAIFSFRMPMSEFRFI
jgi:hypothetical protein